MRVIGIDVVRSAAIFFAMFSHIYADIELGHYMSPDMALPLRVVLQTATPIFVLLFGTMLELVYFPKWVSGKRQMVTSRLLKRALQCWILYALSIFCLFLVDDGYSWKFSISCLIFMGNSPYTEILKFYAVALLLTPLLLRLRERAGLWPLVVLALSYQAAWPFLHALPDAYDDLGAPLQIARLIKFLTGFGNRSLMGPSVLHGLSLVIFGLCLGRFISQGRDGKTTGQDTGSTRSAAFARKIAAGLVVSLALTLAGALTVPDAVFRGLANMSLRLNSSVIYFAAGTLSAVSLTLALIWIVDVWAPIRSTVWHSVSFFGRTSMFTFAWGNMLLYLLDYRPTNAVSAYGTAGLLLAAICLMSFCFDRAMRRSRRAGALLEMINRPLDRLTRLSIRP
ncbi:OpgC domain-containing protein [Falsirhodobacter sp. 1013]|uniref:OpgC domain-containing protein n=1 Tax=Falsirhodobacter sp. 1013 TaxID=3417566 RepID=UPI003EB6A0B0